MSYVMRAKRARYTGKMNRGLSRLRMRGLVRYQRVPSIVNRVNHLYRMIETKESCRKSGVNIALPHNNVTVVQDGNIAADLNMFRMTLGAGDPMAAGDGNRVGDNISLRGVLIKGFFENALGRPKVYYRVMVIRGSKGETFSRANLFKGVADNKMIDQINTERFTVVAQKIFNISAANVAASGVEAANGAPLTSNAGGVGSRVMKMWIPGRKFGKQGLIQYENANGVQVKFYDYRIVIVTYDWYGTPQDINNVGRINELYAKLYFKDA